MAAWEGHTAVVAQLLGAGADVDLASNVSARRPRAERERVTRGTSAPLPYATPRAPPPHATRPQIFIKTLTGRKQAMTFEPTDEVLQIKRQLQEKEGIQVDQIRLIYSGKQLADDKPLEFYNIQAGGTIHMVLQLRGGGGAP